MLPGPARYGLVELNGIETLCGRNDKITVRRIAREEERLSSWWTTSHDAPRDVRSTIDLFPELQQKLSQVPIPIDRSRFRYTRLGSVEIVIESGSSAGAASELDIPGRETAAVARPVQFEGNPQRITFFARLTEQVRRGGGDARKPHANIIR